MSKSIEKKIADKCGKKLFRKAKKFWKSGAFLCFLRTGKDSWKTFFKDKNSAIQKCRLSGILSEKFNVKCCSCQIKKNEYCIHSVAAMLHIGEYVYKKPSYDADSAVKPKYSGLKYKSLPTVLSKVYTPHTAKLVIEAVSDFPHVPSKWENSLLKVKILSEKRNYKGNLANLRQLHFGKTLGIRIDIEQFSLQERQIIRFLALNAEQDGSALSLNSELTSDFFHCLDNFPRFFRASEKITVNGKSAEPVLLAAGKGNLRTLVPSLAVENAFLKLRKTKIITGKAGCWVGQKAEYFWIPGSFDVNWMRSFFRAEAFDARKSTIEKIAASPGKWPLRIVETENSPLRRIQTKTVYHAEMKEDYLQVFLNFSYNDKFCENDLRGLLKIDGVLRERDKKREFFAGRDLKAFGFESYEQNGVVSYKINIDAAGYFFRKFIKDLKYSDDSENILFSAETLKLADFENIEPRIKDYKKNDSDFHIKIDFSVNNEKIHLNNILSALSLNKKFLKTNKNNITEISDELADFVSFIDAVSRYSEDGFLQISNYNIPALADFHKYFPELFPEEILQLSNITEPALLKIHEEKSDKVDFCGELRKYQRKGVDRIKMLLSKKLNCVLGDEMGLGKTIQALALINEMNSSKPALVICPTSLQQNWKREAEKFLKNIRILSIEGNKRKELWRKTKEFDIVISSYAIIKRDIKHAENIHFSTLFLDEAQHIKNPHTANAKVCKTLHSEHRLVLTGTPLENSPSDLWSIFDFLNPGMFANFAEFKKRYMNSPSDEKRSELAIRIAPFLIRRKKKDVCRELPEKIEQQIYCSMEKSQKIFYKNILIELRNMISDSNRNTSNMQIFTALLRLRQICCHPLLLPENLRKNKKIPSAKLKLLKEIIFESLDNNNKMLIFSQFTSMLKLISKELDKCEIPYSYLDGKTKKRMKVVDEFNEGTNPVFLLSLKAGGLGLNLTSADTVVIFDPWWNPAVENQAIDRTHRIGQTKNVNCVKLVVENSIEEKILHLQKKKRRIFDEFVENPAALSGKLTIDDIKSLVF